MISQTSPLLVAQITDTHLFADENQDMKGCLTAHTFQAVLRQLEHTQPRPDLLLMTGDLSQDETSASYEHLRDWVAPLKIPTYWIAGNHDSLPVMQQVLSTDVILPQKRFQQAGWNFILLNSMVPGRVEGELSPEALTDLEQHLQETKQPTLIALHHPPLPIGSVWMDEIGLQNAEAFFAVIDRYPQVKLVIFGHIHQEFEQWRNRVCYLGTPSTCIQFVPEQAEIAIDQQKPGFRLLHLFPDGNHSTQVRRV